MTTNIRAATGQSRQARPATAANAGASPEISPCPKFTALDPDAAQAVAVLARVARGVEQRERAIDIAARVWAPRLWRRLTAGRRAV